MSRIITARVHKTFGGSHSQAGTMTTIDFQDEDNADVTIEQVRANFAAGSWSVVSGYTIGTTKNLVRLRRSNGQFALIAGLALNYQKSSAGRKRIRVVMEDGTSIGEGITDAYVMIDDTEYTLGDCADNAALVAAWNGSELVGQIGIAGVENEKPYVYPIVGVTIVPKVVAIPEAI